MERKRIDLRENIKLIRKRENQRRSLAKRESEQLIIMQEREMGNLERHAKPIQTPQTLQEMGVVFNVTGN